MIDIASYKTVLAFFAHPDDETLGAGGTIARLCQHNVDVHVAIPATGITSRNSEASQEGELSELKADCQRAMAVLGVAKTRLIMGDFPDNQMDSRPLLELTKWLEDIINELKPDLVITHHRYCTNIDHQYCHEAAVVATRPRPGRQIDLICAEIPSSTGYLKPTAWEPDFYVELTRDLVAQKTRAMQEYRSEVQPDPHPRSTEVLEALAKVRGSEAGYLFAEAFMIQKCFG